MIILVYLSLRAIVWWTFFEVEPTYLAWALVTYVFFKWIWITQTKKTKKTSDWWLVPNIRILDSFFKLLRQSWSAVYFSAHYYPWKQFRDFSDEHILCFSLRFHRDESCERGTKSSFTCWNPVENPFSCESWIVSSGLTYWNTAFCNLYLWYPVYCN